MVQRNGYDHIGLGNGRVDNSSFLDLIASTGQPLIVSQTDFKTFLQSIRRAELGITTHGVFQHASILSSHAIVSATVRTFRCVNFGQTENVSMFLTGSYIERDTTSFSLSGHG